MLAAGINSMNPDQSVDRSGFVLHRRWNMELATMSEKSFSEMIAEIERLKNENKKLRDENDRLQIVVDEYDREHVRW